ncbi:UvrD-helicase domain-containing protein [Marinomonas transparens]|uniref:UvrD-helicase domain-containing protein n=1 Tax=Marinomonas transparens TaxID=2795388 RepID=A0A934JNY1_9GAMM|nr:UvrD-helicase domain-containing protein [Marinomonas transparens]MBJ7539730.1 UvrD-helicase domain-containing protein [Marinomonas transparens]
MNSIRSLLSCGQNKDAPPFSAEDIKWVELVLGLKNGFDEHQITVLQNLDELDVEACPGSGKTTVLVAKLALLSRYWTSKTQGVCVLSMTNAAREEIQERLGSTFEGQRLLRHPHFIGTIHSFFSDFLAKPYLNSKGIPLVSIDDDLCRSQRRKLLQKDNYLPLTDHFVAEQVRKRLDDIKSSKSTTKKHIEAQQWLVEHEVKSESEQRLGIPLYWKVIDEFYNTVRVTLGGDKPFELSADLELLLRKCVEEVVNKGVFCFSDIFVFSKALMNTSEDVYKIIRARFPLLFIDEAQDTSSSQTKMLHKLFLSDIPELNAVTRQRFGDANQTIYTFEPPMPSDGLDPYPSPSIAGLTLPVSHRFDQSISSIAAIFETNPLDIAMQGVRAASNGGCNHCVLVFSEETRSFVIPAFAELLSKELASFELESANVKVCSHVHKERDGVPSTEEFARTIRDYYTPYIADKMTKEYQQHSYLIDYLNHGRYLIRDTKSLFVGLEKFAEGVLRACFLISSDSLDDIKGTSFSKIKSVANKHSAIKREVGDSLSAAYTQVVLQSLTNQNKVDEHNWEALTAIVLEVISSLTDRSDIDSSKVKFIDWHEVDLPDSHLEEGAGERNNLYRHKFNDSDNTIDLRLGTIHSVKGQTHTATLLLESTNRGPILGQLKPYLLGEQRANEATGSKKNWLNTLYVGLTRPTHLICLAIPESHKKTATSNIDWTSEDFEKLKTNGWKVARVNKELQLDFI